jgi:hypothetical protein
VRGYLNDWPQRSVVAMHSSARVVGSLCQAAAIVCVFDRSIVVTPTLATSEVWSSRGRAASGCGLGGR